MAIGILSLFSFAASSKEMTQMEHDWLIRKASDSGLPLSQRIECYDSLIKLLGKDVPYSILFDKAALLERKSRFTEALSVYQNAYSIIPKDSLSVWCKMMRERARLGVYNRNYMDALESAYELARVEKPDSLLNQNFEAHTLLVDIYRMLRNSHMAGQYYDKAKEDLAEMGKKGGFKKSMIDEYRGKIYRLDAHLRLDSGNVDGVWEDIKLARNLAHDSLSNLKLAALTAHLCRILGDYEQMDYYYRDAIAMDLPHPNTLAVITNYVLTSAQNKPISEARAIYENFAPRLKELKGGIFENLYYRILYYLSIREGNKDAAIAYLDSAYFKNDSIHNSQHRRNASMLADRLEYEQMRSNWENAQKDIRQKTMLNVILCLVIIGAIIVLYLLFRRHRKGKEENANLESKIANIGEIHHKEMTMTQTDLEARKKDLVLMAMRNSRLDDALNDIKRLASDSKQSKGDALKAIQKIVAGLDSDREGWAQFQAKIEEAYPNFFNKLYKVCPSLTNAEIRQAAFILMNMTVGEVAELTCRSARTVGTIRYNLRKKLGITGSTEAWMKQLSITPESELNTIS